MIYIFLADGFEEIEALAPLDLFRRAGIEAKTVGISGNEIVGSHGITVKTDLTVDDLLIAANQVDPELIVLPGGMPGTTNLQNSKTVQKMVSFCANNNIRIAAICAAPLILGENNLLNGKNAVCFPGFEEHLHGANIVDEGVVTDGLITTAKSAGHAIAFGLELVGLLKGKEAAEKLRFSLMQQ